MNRLILLTVICCLSGACSQTAKSTEDSRLITGNDSLQSSRPAKGDTTEIDPVKVSPDKYKILLENEYVRVVEYSLKPGEKDNTHTHPAKTIYVISGGTLRVYPGNEKPIDFEEIKGTTEWSDRVGKHYVENIGKTTITILLTEIKSVRKK